MLLRIANAKVIKLRKAIINTVNSRSVANKKKGKKKFNDLCINQVKL